MSQTNPPATLELGHGPQVAQAKACLFEVSGQILTCDGPAVQQFVRIEKLTALSRAPHAMLGVFAVRGQVRSLYRLERLLGIPESATRPEQAALLTVDGHTFGIAVNQIYGFPTFHPAALEACRVVPEAARGCCLGEITLEDKRAWMLDLSKVFQRIEDLFLKN